MLWKIDLLSVDYLCGGHTWLESDFSFIPKYCGNSGDVTLVQPISKDFTNQWFMVSTWICTAYMSFMIAKSYSEFKAFFQTIRFTSKKSFKHFASLKGLNFSSKFKRKKSLRWSWMNISFVICTVWSSLGTKILKKRIKKYNILFHDSGRVFKV